MQVAFVPLRRKGSRAPHRLGHGILDGRDGPALHTFAFSRAAILPFFLARDYHTLWYFPPPADSRCLPLLNNLGVLPLSRYCFSNKMSSVTPKLVVFNLNIGNPRHEQAMEDGKADRVSSMVNELAESLYGQCDRPFPCPKDDVRACVRACLRAARG